MKSGESEKVPKDKIHVYNRQRWLSYVKHAYCQNKRDAWIPAYCAFSTLANNIIGGVVFSLLLLEKSALNTDISYVLVANNIEGN